MKKLLFLSVVWLGVACSKTHAFDAAASESARFVIGNERINGLHNRGANVSIQTLKITAVEGMPPARLKRINEQLGDKVKNLYGEMKLCSASADGHPWGFDVKFEKVLVSSRYISAIFKKSTVCAGSPNLDKVALVFSKLDGKLVSGAALVKELVSQTANAAASGPLNEGKVKLDESSVERMLEDSESAAIDYDERCDFYLKTTYYSAWVDGQRLVLFPEFSQPNSFCQKEYIIETRK